MTDDAQQTAEMIRSGEYFREARAWYRSIYIGPVSERTFFLIVAILAGLIGIFGVLAVVEILPVTTHPAILIANDRMDDAVPAITPIKTRKQLLNPALMRFFVEMYVTSRESYLSADYLKNFNFVHAHSDEPSFDQYVDIYGSNNPQSPAAILGETGARYVSIDSIVINDKVDPHVATVHFTTELAGTDDPNRTQWTAVIQFYYTDLLVKEVVNPKNHRHTLETTDPQFQVVNYALSKTP